MHLPIAPTTPRPSQFNSPVTRTPEAKNFHALCVTLPATSARAARPLAVKNLTALTLPFFSSTNNTSKNGCLQVLGRVAEKEAVRCHEILVQSQMLGVQTEDCRAQSVETLKTRQGQKTRLQGQAGLCDLPHQSQKRWQKETCPQGCHLR